MTHATRQEIDALRARAEAGVASAQFSLGFRYNTGQGVPQDYVEAARWYRLAADQGYASAPPGSTVGADKGYDVASVVAAVRHLDVTPHVAQKARSSAIDGRTTRHPGYAVSGRKRKLVEQVFGWMKTVGGLRKLRHRGVERVDWTVTFAATVYNLVRLRNLGATCP